jgi:hypothetical protein
MDIYSALNFKWNSRDNHPWKKFYKMAIAVKNENWRVVSHTHRAHRSICNNEKLLTCGLVDMADRGTPDISKLL